MLSPLFIESSSEREWGWQRLSVKDTIAGEHRVYNGSYMYVTAKFTDKNIVRTPKSNLLANK